MAEYCVHVSFISNISHYI